MPGTRRIERRPEMIEKENWMVIGAHVLADGIEGTISAIHITKIGDIEWVRYIDVKTGSKKLAERFHPIYVEELKEGGNQ